MKRKILLILCCIAVTFLIGCTEGEVGNEEVSEPIVLDKNIVIASDTSNNEAKNNEQDAKGKGQGMDAVSVSTDNSAVKTDIDATINESVEMLSSPTPVATQEPTPEPTPEPTEEAKNAAIDPSALADNTPIAFDSSWEYASFSKINSGSAVFYKAQNNRKNIVVAVNAGHGTSGGSKVKTYCHPDMSPKTTGGSTQSGATQATAVAGGMSFNDGASEASVTLALARKVRDSLLANGYDVLMLRDGDDVQLDNVARTVMANNLANCHIALHFDGDGLDHDKGCFYIRVPDGIKDMAPVSSHYESHDALGEAILNGLSENGCIISKNRSMAVDLTQTSYSTIPSVDMELGNQCTDHSDAYLDKLAAGCVSGINKYFGQ